MLFSASTAPDCSKAPPARPDFGIFPTFLRRRTSLSHKAGSCKLFFSFGLFVAQTTMRFSMLLIFKKLYVRIFSELIIRMQSAMENLVRNGAMLCKRGSEPVHNLMSSDAIPQIGSNDEH
jgi:hypothetical protein